MMFELIEEKYKVNWNFQDSQGFQFLNKIYWSWNKYDLFVYVYMFMLYVHVYDV